MPLKVGLLFWVNYSEFKFGSCSAEEKLPRGLVMSWMPSLMYFEVKGA